MFAMAFLQVEKEKTEAMELEVEGARRDFVVGLRVVCYEIVNVCPYTTLLVNIAM